VTRANLRVAAALVALALVCGCAWVAFTWSRASLEAGATAGPVAGLTGSSADGGWVVERGAPEFVFAQTVRNSSSVAITVTGIARYAGDPSDVDATYVPTDPDVGGVGANVVGRAFPARLKPGQELYLLVRTRPHGCAPMAPGSGYVFDRVEVKYRLFGVGRTANIAFPAPIKELAAARLHKPGCP
jgi:hypothetical protein